MHLKRLFTIGSVAAFIILVILSSPLPAVAGSLGENVGGAFPVIYSPINEFGFPAVIEGTKVLHEFTVVNKGSAVLIIQNVLTG